MSITARIWSVFILAIVAVAVLVTLMGTSMQRARDTVDWVNHTQTVLREKEAMLSDLNAAESAARGYVLRGNQSLREEFERESPSALSHLSRLKSMTADRNLQQQRLDSIQGLVSDKLSLMAQIVRAKASGDEATLEGALSSGRGHALMIEIRSAIEEFAQEEERLLAERQEEFEATAVQLRMIVGIGVLTAAALLLLGTMVIVHAIRRPLRRLLEGTEHLGRGESNYRVPVTGRTEFAALASAFNNMAERLHRALEQRRQSTEQLEELNRNLISNQDSLKMRNREITLLSTLAEHLQSCLTLKESFDVVSRFGAEMFARSAGAVFLINNSRTTISPVAHWGNAEPEGDFAPDDCWAIRRGRPHVLDAAHAELQCKHVPQQGQVQALCIPMMAQGDVIGVLNLMRLRGEDDSVPVRPWTTDEQRLATAMSEQVALSIANQRLRETLRSQSIRDALTGLYNRRYLDESLDREIARAIRGKTPLALLMIDVDHFKRFNTDFGHAAGDAVLASLGRLIAGHFRTEDIICRYGGEELLCILPGSQLADARRRADDLRSAIKSLSVSSHGQPLPPISVSIGLAVFPDHGASADALLQAADSALRLAKRQGRDRVVVLATDPILLDKAS